MRKSPLLLILVMLIIGCAPQKLIFVQPTYIETIKPELNQISEVELGESLIIKETGKKFKGIVLTDDYEYKFASDPRPLKLAKGSTFILTNESSKYKYFSKEGTSWALAMIKQSGIIVLAQDVSGIHKYTVLTKEIPTTKFQFTEVPVFESNYLKQEFIYNGKVNNGIKFTYREFSDNLARPAFTQDIQYDLSESNVIGFKGLRIEIISAENIKIKYKVLSYYK